MKLEIVIQGKPIVQQRPRLGKWRNFYDPSSKEKKALGLGLLASRLAHRMAIFEGDLTLDVTFHGTGGKCDLDNCLKALLDASNKVLWIDDRQITRICAQMIRKSDDPRTHLILRHEVIP